MNYWLIIILVVVHMIITLGYCIFIKLRISNIPGHMLAVVFLIPVFGLVSAICIEWLYIHKKDGQKEISLEKMKLGLGESIFYQYMVEENEDAAFVVPLEEALLINDVHTRRSIMLDILHKSPSQYIDLLKIARFNYDTEVTHYATTSIMEAQREYELELQKCREDYRENHDLESALDLYITVVKNYVKSGILEGELLNKQRSVLDELYSRKIMLRPNKKQLYLDMLENDINRGQYKKAGEIAAHIQERWPDDEKIWLASLNLCVSSKDRFMLRDLITKIETSAIKWTAKGRERLSFFTECCTRQ